MHPKKLNWLETGFKTGFWGLNLHFTTLYMVPELSSGYFPTSKWSMIFVSLFFMLFTWYSWFLAPKKSNFWQARIVTLHLPRGFNNLRTINHTLLKFCISVLFYEKRQCWKFHPLAQLVKKLWPLKNLRKSGKERSFWVGCIVCSKFQIGLFLFLFVFKLPNFLIEN